MILTKLGYTATYREAPGKRVLAELERGGPSSLTTSAFKRPERESYAYFSDVYRNESILLFVRKGETARYPFKTLSELSGSGFEIGVVRGPIYGDEYATLMKDPNFIKQIQEVSSEEQNYLKLVCGRLDGVLGAYSTFYPIARKNKMLDKVEPLMTVVTIPLRFMFSKSAVTPEFIDAFNRELEIFKQGKNYQLLFEKYQVSPNMLSQ